MDDSLKYESIPSTREKVNNLFTMYYMSGDQDGLSSMIDHDHETTLITSLGSIMSTEDIFSLVRSMTTYIEEHVFSAEKISITGMIVVIRDMVLMVIRSSLLSIAISVVLIGLITALFFGRLYWGALSIIPLFSAVILNFGLMGHFNITLNHITAILSSIIIGVGVDFAIHYISQFQKGKKCNQGCSKGCWISNFVGCWIQYGFWCIDIFSLLAGTVYWRAHGVCNDFYLPRNPCSTSLSYTNFIRSHF